MKATAVQCFGFLDGDREVVVSFSIAHDVGSVECWSTVRLESNLIVFRDGSLESILLPEEAGLQVEGDLTEEGSDNKEVCPQFFGGAFRLVGTGFLQLDRKLFQMVGRFEVELV